MEPMGNQAAYSEKGREIVDFLYRDLSKVNSFYAQIFQGNLIAVTKLQEETKSGRWQLSGGVASLVQGLTSRREESRWSIAEQIDPHDAKALLVLNELAIPVFQGSLADTETGQIVLLQGEIALRNYQAIKVALPHLLEAGLLDVDLAKQNKTKKEQKREKRAFSELVSLIPGGFEFEILTSNKELAIGPINPDYLTVNPDDLLRLYGNFIPGTWFALGIINHTSPSRSLPNSTEFRSALDDFANAISSLYSARTRYTVFPILVFRGLQY